MSTEALKTQNGLTGIEIAGISNILKDYIIKAEELTSDVYNHYVSSPLLQCLNGYSVDESSSKASEPNFFKKVIENIFGNSINLGELSKGNFDYTISLKKGFLVFTENNSGENIAGTVVDTGAKDVVGILADGAKYTTPDWVNRNISGGFSSERFNKLVFTSRYDYPTESEYADFVKETERKIYTKPIYGKPLGFHEIQNAFVNKLMEAKRDSRIIESVEAISIKDKKIIIGGTEYSFGFSSGFLVIYKDDERVTNPNKVEEQRTELAEFLFEYERNGDFVAHFIDSFSLGNPVILTECIQKILNWTNARNLNQLKLITAGEIRETTIFQNEKACRVYLEVRNGNDVYSFELFYSGNELELS